MVMMFILYCGMTQFHVLRGYIYVNECNLSTQVPAKITILLLNADASTDYWTVCYETIFKRGQLLAPILQSSRIRDEAFGRFWVAITANQPAIQPQDSSSSPKTPPSQSADLIPPLLTKASGIVLDIGPGTGTQIPLLGSPAIKAIYGPEPCRTLHPALTMQINSCGLGNKYHVLPCSAEASELLPALQKEGLVTTISPEKETGGVFDTIICVRVLCSVPNPEKTVRDLYSLLRPGGKMLVTEHVVNPWWTAKGSVVARAMQGVYELLGWRWVMGNCCLSRDTEGTLLRAAERDGGWGVVELERSFGMSAIPYVSGMLVKKEVEKKGL